MTSINYYNCCNLIINVQKLGFFSSKIKFFCFIQNVAIKNVATTTEKKYICTLILKKSKNTKIRKIEIITIKQST